MSVVSGQLSVEEKQIPRCGRCATSLVMTIEVVIALVLQHIDDDESDVVLLGGSGRRPRPDIIE